MPCRRQASPKRAGTSPPRPRARSKPTPPARPPSTSNCCAGAAAPRGRAGDWTGTMTNKLSGTRRYLALFFPFLPAERLLRTAPRPPDAPLVFAEKARGAMRLASVDAAALAGGLRPEIGRAHV